MGQITCENLTFRYPGRVENALDGIQFQIGAGEYVLLCGKSGCGKTTLLRQLKPAVTPHGSRSGRVTLDGTPVEQLSFRDQSTRIGYVMQDPDSQIVTDQVWHELAFGLENLGLDQQTIRLRVAEMAQFFGLQVLFHRKVESLSGGQKQLVNLAAVMVMQPDVLVLDEPTSQLDPVSASEFFQVIDRINRELGVTVLLSEHRLEGLYAAVDRVIMLDRGRVVASGTPEETARQLMAEGSDLIAALPAPVQISFGVTGGRDCPLTVREGRLWLASYGKPAGPAPAPAEERESPKNPAIQVKDVWFRYGKDGEDVLRGVEFAVARGSFSALVGGNGSGKSTLLKSICGRCRPYRGTVKVDGKKVERYHKGELFQRRLALLPQNPKYLFVHKTVAEDLAELGGEAAVERAVECTGIRELLNSHPYDLSGGELQKAALAKVLLLEPSILLLDEPTKGLDAFYKEQFARLLARFQGKGGTILMVSHDVEFCARFADEAALFFDGGVTAIQPARRFFAGNQFYTTAAARMSRAVFPEAVTNEEVIALCNGKR